MVAVCDLCASLHGCSHDKAWSQFGVCEGLLGKGNADRVIVGLRAATQNNVAKLVAAGGQAGNLAIIVDT